MALNKGDLYKFLEPSQNFFTEWSWYNCSFQHERNTFGKRCSYLMRSIQADPSMGVSPPPIPLIDPISAHPFYYTRTSNRSRGSLQESNHTRRSESVTPRKKRSLPALSGSCWRKRRRRRSLRVPRKNKFHRVSGLATPMVHSPLTPEIGLRELEDHTGIYGRGGRRRGTKLVIP